MVDLYLNQDKSVPAPLPVTTHRAQEPVLRVIANLHEAGQTLAHVVGADGKTVGLVTLRQLSEALFGGR